MSDKIITLEEHHDNHLEEESQTPTVEDVKQFLDAFNALDSFSATQQLIRGYGCNIKEKGPSVRKVLRWLKDVYGLKGDYL